MRCGLRFEPKVFESSGTFYTLCEECGEEVLQSNMKREKKKEENLHDLFKRTGMLE